MTLESHKLIQALKQKGFVQEPSDHKRFRLYVDGRKSSVKTMVSHGAKHTLSDGLSNTIQKQLGFATSSELRSFVDCGIDHTQHVRLLIERGRVKLPE